MLEKVLSKNSSIIISTGNVISINNKKAGQKPDLEVIILKICLIILYMSSVTMKIIKI